VCTWDAKQTIRIDACKLLQIISASSAAPRTTMGAATRADMSRKLVWVEQTGLRCWGCSECAWVFNPSGALTGKSFDEAKRNFELQRDKEFTLHVCAQSPKSQEPKRKA
jgi:hypothetical protein